MWLYYCFLHRQRRELQSNPLTYNGAERDAYYWSQTITEVDLRVKVSCLISLSFNTYFAEHNVIITLQNKTLNLHQLPCLMHFNDLWSAILLVVLYLDFQEPCSSLLFFLAITKIFFSMAQNCFFCNLSMFILFLFFHSAVYELIFCDIQILQNISNFILVHSILKKFLQHYSSVVSLCFFLQNL